MTTIESVEIEQDVPPGEGTPRWRRWAPGVAAVGVSTAAVGVHAGAYGAWIEDDAGITFAYARSIATGAGVVLQPGAAPVEGFSDPLWLAVLVVGRWLGLFDHGAWFGLSDLVAFPKLVALACCAGVFWCFYAAAKTLTSRPALVAGAAGVATACAPPFVIWCFSGLENPLFALLVVALASVLVRAVATGALLEDRTATATGLLAACAGLTRPDGLIYVLAFPLVVLALTAERPQAARGWAVTRSVVAFAVPCLIYLVVRLAVFGDWLPNTARAKLQGDRLSTALDRPAELFGYLGWALALVTAVVVAVALARAAEAVRPALVALLVPFGLCVVAFASLDPDWMGWFRFATPFWPLLALLVALSVAVLAPAMGVRGRAAVAGVLAAALVVSMVAWVPNAQLFRAGPQAPLCRMVAQGEAMILNGLADRLGVPPGQGSFVGVDGGGVGVASRLAFVDAVGLTDARVAGYWQAGDMAGLRDYVLAERRPTFYAVYGDWDIYDTTRGVPGPHLREDPRFRADYVQVWSAGTRAPTSPASGIWVRREAVSSPAALAGARSYVLEQWATMRTLYPTPESLRGWSCGDTLRPGATLASTAAQGR